MMKGTGGKAFVFECCLDARYLPKFKAIGCCTNDSVFSISKPYCSYCSFTDCATLKPFSHYFSFCVHTLNCSQTRNVKPRSVIRGRKSEYDHFDRNSDDDEVLHSESLEETSQSTEQPAENNVSAITLSSHLWLFVISTGQL